MYMYVPCNTCVDFSCVLLTTQHYPGLIGPLRYVTYDARRVADGTMLDYVILTHSLSEEPKQNCDSIKPSHWFGVLWILKNERRSWRE